MIKAVFVDRDGVINKKVAEHDYVKKWEEFELLTPTVVMLKEYQENGYLLVVVSNQRGVARGMLSQLELDRINDNMCKLLADKGVDIAGVYCCVHGLEDNCDCRKPKPGLILNASEELDINIKESIMIGDSRSDIECGKNAGCRENLLFEIKKGEIVLTPN